MTLPVLSIGPHRLDTPILLAPMAGYTDAAFRSVCAEHGCPLTFTEVVTGAGLAHNSSRTLFMLHTHPAEARVAAHMYGSDPAVMAEAARVIEGLNRFAFIDINCGCPVPKIVSKGAGAALMRDPARLEAVVRAVRDAVRLPVTVKTRTGFSVGQGDIFDIARAVEVGGGAALFLHARLASDRHSGEADWPTLARVKAHCSIPVIGNGGIVRPEDAVRMFDQTGVDGVMIGRAAVGHPWLFNQIRRHIAGQPAPPPTPAEQRAVIAEHLRRLVELKRLEQEFRRRRRSNPEGAAASHFRGHLIRYLAGAPGWSAVRRHLDKIRSPDDVMNAVDQALLPSGRTE